MTPDDLNVRNETYRLFVALGPAPSLGDVASTMRATSVDVRQAWVRLHE